MEECEGKNVLKRGTEYIGKFMNVEKQEVILTYKGMKEGGVHMKKEMLNKRL